MKTIWKYQLEISRKNIIPMPEGAKILTVQIQNEVPCVWVEVESENQPIEKTLMICGTGHPIPGGSLKYIGTYQIENGAFVFHLYERL